MIVKTLHTARGGVMNSFYKAHGADTVNNTCTGADVLADVLGIKTETQFFPLHESWILKHWEGKKKVEKVK